MATKQKTVQLPAATVAEVVQLSKDSVQKLAALQKNTVDEMQKFVSLLSNLDRRVEALEKPHVVRTPRIELADKHGNVRITLDALPDGPCIRLWDKDHRVKASFGLLTTDQPTLLFLEGYLPRVDLRLEEDGQPSFGMISDRSMNVAEVLIERGKRLTKQLERKAKKQPAKARERKQ